MGIGGNKASSWLRAIANLGSFALSVVLLASAALTHAQSTPDYTLFGPKQYVNVQGTTNDYLDTFSVPIAVGAPFTLQIINGAASGANRVSSASIRVNGVEVAGQADFGQNIAFIERAVNLSPNNTLEVRIASAPGAYLTMRVLGTRILPVPTQLAPNPLALTTGASGNLTATLSPAPTSAG
ncbi:MAG TPA: hypothetical protein VFI62_11075, partial [Burkholderiales bacterium]|nr:hypothetical protein [Burkholderiales bacterium]